MQVVIDKITSALDGAIQISEATNQQASAVQELASKAVDISNSQNAGQAKMQDLISGAFDSSEESKALTKQLSQIRT